MQFIGFVSILVVDVVDLLLFFFFFSEILVYYAQNKFLITFGVKFPPRKKINKTNSTSFFLFIFCREGRET